jgi:hypothetical protein
LKNDGVTLVNRVGSGTASKTPTAISARIMAHRHGHDFDPVFLNRVPYLAEKLPNMLRRLLNRGDEILNGLFVLADKDSGGWSREVGKLVPLEGH